MTELELLRLTEDAEKSPESFKRLLEVAADALDINGVSVSEYIDVGERHLSDLAKGRRQPTRVTVLALECIIRRFDNARL